MNVAREIAEFWTVLGALFGGVLAELLRAFVDVCTWANSV
jgi:hypothetical protein